MNVYFAYLSSFVLVVVAAFLVRRTVQLQQHIKVELRALRTSKEAKAQQAKLVASLNASQASVAFTVRNYEAGMNSYSPVPVNKPVEIHNSYSL